MACSPAARPSRRPSTPCTSSSSPAAPRWTSWRRAPSSPSLPEKCWKRLRTSTSPAPAALTACSNGRRCCACWRQSRRAPPFLRTRNSLARPAIGFGLHQAHARPDLLAQKRIPAPALAEHDQRRGIPFDDAINDLDMSEGAVPLGRTVRFKHTDGRRAAFALGEHIATYEPMICDMPGDRIALRLPQQEVAVKQEAQSIDLDRLGRVFVEEAK